MSQIKKHRWFATSALCILLIPSSLFASDNITNKIATAKIQLVEETQRTEKIEAEVEREQKNVNRKMSQLEHVHKSLITEISKLKIRQEIAKKKRDQLVAKRKKMRDELTQLSVKLNQANKQLKRLHQQKKIEEQLIKKHSKDKKAIKSKFSKIKKKSNQDIAKQ